VVSSNTFVGFFGGSNVALVTGAGSVWSNRADLFVGFAGPGNQMVISNGATVTASNVFVGFQPSSSDNRLIVDGGTLRANVLDLRRGYSNFLNAGVIEVAHLLNDNSNSRLIFKGGRLAAGRITIANGLAFEVGDGVSPATLHLTGDNTHSFSFILPVRANATLMGNGTVLVPVSVQSGSTLSPGHAPGSIGLLGASGSAVFAGTNILELTKSGAARASDQVLVGGAITFVNATILVTHLGPDALAAGDRFQLFTATSFAGSIQTVSLPPLAFGLRWKTNFLVDGAIEVESRGLPLRYVRGRDAWPMVRQPG
jgi:T5SS/PEP-CTERM-associated repeat protein